MSFTTQINFCNPFLADILLTVATLHHLNYEGQLEHFMILTSTFQPYLQRDIANKIQELCNHEVMITTRSRITSLGCLLGLCNHWKNTNADSQYYKTI